MKQNHSDRQIVQERERTIVCRQCIFVRPEIRSSTCGRPVVFPALLASESPRVRGSKGTAVQESQGPRDQGVQGSTRVRESKGNGVQGSKGYLARVMIDDRFRVTLANMGVFFGGEGGIDRRLNRLVELQLSLPWSIESGEIVCEARHVGIEGWSASHFSFFGTVGQTRTNWVTRAGVHPWATHCVCLLVGSSVR